MRTRRNSSINICDDSVFQSLDRAFILPRQHGCVRLALEGQVAAGFLLRLYFRDGRGGVDPKKVCLEPVLPGLDGKIHALREVS